MPAVNDICGVCGVESVLQDCLTCVCVGKSERVVALEKQNELLLDVVRKFVAWRDAKKYSTHQRDQFPRGRNDDMRALEFEAALKRVEGLL